MDGLKDPEIKHCVVYECRTLALILELTPIRTTWDDRPIEYTYRASHIASLLSNACEVDSTEMWKSGPTEYKT